MPEEPQDAANDAQEDVLARLWRHVNKRVRQGPVNRGLWDAVMAAVPVAVEDQTLVVGLKPQDMRHAGYMETATNRAMVEQILEGLTGRRLGLRVIEGTTSADWDRAKDRDQLMERRERIELGAREARRDSAEAWHDLQETLVRMFTSGTATRQPVDTARLLGSALRLLSDTDTRTRAEDPEGTVLHDKQLNRICDRLASYCEMSSTEVALHYLQLREGQRRGSGGGEA